MNNELLEVILRTLLVFVILFILTKGLGKKQVSQMNLFDYLIGITIGSIAADISLDIEKNLLAGIFSLIIYGLFGMLVTYITLKNISIRRFILGTPTILIEDGKIIEQNLKKEGIDLNDLQEEARQNGYFDLSKINYAILEISGKISFLAKSKNEIITKEDMKIKKKNESLCANIIMDGIILEQNLNNMNKNRIWLDKELKKRGYNDYQKILLMTLDQNNKIMIYKKNSKNKFKIFE